MNMLEVVKKDIPNFIFEEAKKYKLVYPIKNSINAQPGDIVILPEEKIGIYIKKFGSYHLVNFVLNNGQFGVKQINIEDELRDIKLCERQTEKPYESKEHLFLDKIRDVFRQYSKILKCPSCLKHKIVLHQDEEYTECYECGKTTSFASSIVYIKNEIAQIESRRIDAVN